MAAISSSKLDIALQVKKIKETAVNNKRSYNEFLNEFILVDKNRLSIEASKVVKHILRDIVNVESIYVKM